VTTESPTAQLPLCNLQSWQQLPHSVPSTESLCLGDPGPGNDIAVALRPSPGSLSLLPAVINDERCPAINNAQGQQCSVTTISAVAAKSHQPAHILTTCSHRGLVDCKRAAFWGEYAAKLHLPPQQVASNSPSPLPRLQITQSPSRVH
jgi:hypothetical protein